MTSNSKMNAHEFLAINKKGESEIIDVWYLATNIRSFDKIYLRNDTWIDADKITNARAQIIVQMAEDTSFYDFGKYRGGLFDVINACVYHYMREENVVGRCNEARITSKEVIRKYRLQAFL